MAVKDSTRRAVDELIERLAEMSDADDVAEARELIAHQGLDVLRVLAVAALVDAARRKRRAAVLVVERDATTVERTPEQQARLDESARQIEAEYEASQERFRADMDAAITSLTASLRREWNAELLGQSFALPDGTVTTWGEATVQQHEDRAAMFERNAVANAEGAARHRAAIADLREGEVRTLAELVGAAA